MGGAVSVEERQGPAVEQLRAVQHDAPPAVLSRLRREIETFLADFVTRHAQSAVTVTVFRASGLAKLDAQTKSDPYVAVSVSKDGVVSQGDFLVTEAQRDTEHPHWGPLGHVMKLDGVCGLDWVLVQAYDLDGRTGAPAAGQDDLLGQAALPLIEVHGSRGETVTVDLQAISGEGEAESAGQVALSVARDLELPDVASDAPLLAVVQAFASMLPEGVDERVQRNLGEDCEALLRAYAAVVHKYLDGGDVLRALDQLSNERGRFRTVLHRMYDAMQKGELDALVEALQSLPAAAPDGPRHSVVVRKEIRTMSAEEQARYVAAVKRMMQSESPGGSEWLRVAGYHGWPSNDGAGYCVHRAEAFPGWHRAYLLEMEAALQEADRANGNDGRIAQPYWDFSQSEVNGQVMPSVIREHFTGGFAFPDNFWPADAPQTKGLATFQDKLFRHVRSERGMLAKLKRGKVQDLSAACLDRFRNEEHWQHASTENRTGIAVEAPHNSTHNAVGFPLSSLKFAAFHPMFWLLHANTDRQYEKYLELCGRAECLQELMSHQAIREDGGFRNLATSPCEPFKAPEAVAAGESRAFLLEDAMAELHHLGYDYDRLPPEPKQQLRELPTFALFRGVDVAKKLIGPDGEIKSFDIHVYIADHDAAPALREQLAKQIGEVAAAARGDAADDAEAQLFEGHANYAGLCSLFGGKGPACENCRDNSTINARVELNDAMHRLGLLGRHRIALVCVAEDEDGALAMLESVPSVFGAGIEIPEPQVVGPLFEDGAGGLSVALGAEAEAEGGAAAAAAAAETRTVQSLLTQRGYYEAATDGQFGPKTDDAVKRFQAMAGVRTDGIVGPVTRALLAEARYDAKKDVETARTVFSVGQTIKYWVGPSPGYLDRERVLAEIALATGEWASTTLFTFERAEARQDADITLMWSDHRRDNKLDAFDGVGGEVARADNTGVTFDVSERWTCEPHEPNMRAFRLASVALHELGHVLGLTHQSGLEGQGGAAVLRRVMSPFYLAARVQLTRADKRAVRELYGAGAE